MAKIRPSARQVTDVGLQISHTKGKQSLPAVLLQRRAAQPMAGCPASGLRPRVLRICQLFAGWHL
eukprot:1632630-Karenia_brevis.AAC.1